LRTYTRGEEPSAAESPWLAALLQRIGDSARKLISVDGLTGIVPFNGERRGYARFMSDRFLQTLEYRQNKFPDQQPAGRFMANVGGSLSGCLYRLSGLRLGADGPETWGRRRVVLPAGPIEVSVLMLAWLMVATRALEHADVVRPQNVLGGAVVASIALAETGLSQSIMRSTAD
jgi:hypothetical protein